MAMQKPSCKNTPQYLSNCCSPIGQNNTKDFLLNQEEALVEPLEMVLKDSIPWGFFHLIVNLGRFISLPELFPLAPTNRPWVSEVVLPPAKYNKETELLITGSKSLKKID